MVKHKCSCSSCLSVELLFVQSESQCTPWRLAEEGQEQCNAILSACTSPNHSLQIICRSVQIPMAIHSLASEKELKMAEAEKQKKKFNQVVATPEQEVLDFWRLIPHVCFSPLPAEAALCLSSAEVCGALGRFSSSPWVLLQGRATALPFLWNRHLSAGT